MILFTFVLFSTTMFFQSEAELNIKLEKLQKQRASIIKSLNEVDMKIQDLGDEIKTIKQAKNPLSFPYLETVSKTYLRDEPSIFGKKIATIPKGTRLKVIGFKGTMWEVEYGEMHGYVIKLDVEKDEIEEVFKAKEKLLDAQIQNFNDKKRKEQFKKAQENRKIRLVEKYGSLTGKTIIDSKISIGMTKEMVIDSWGKPSDINTTITEYGVHEQWVYGSGSYVYFEDGIVTTIQN